MADSETTPLIQSSDDAEQSTGHQSWREWTGARLQSHRFHSTVFALIVVDCVIVVVELCWVLLHECTPGRDYNPTWLEILVDLSMFISCLFLLEIPSSLFAFGWRFYYPWSDEPHSTFHLLDALIIIMNFAILFLRGPGQEIGGLIVLLRLWRLVKLLGGVATGVEGLNETLQYNLECAEKELAAKVQQLAEAQQTIEDLQRKLNATQP